MTVINDLIYIPKKKIKEVYNKKEKVNVEVLKGQIAVEEVIVEAIEDMLIKETGVSMKRVKSAIKYAESKKATNIFSYARETIKNNWDIKINESENMNIKGFNNFEARNYDYDTLERKLLGWETEEDKEKSLFDFVI